LIKIDAHQHFWQYDPVVYSWIGQDMEVLKQDFLPDKLKQIYDQEDINGCVAVQADQSESETDFLLSLAEKNEFIKGVVGWVDLRSEHVGERLSHYSKHPKCKGFRHIAQSEPDNNFLISEQFIEGISHLHNFGFTYDILIYPKQLSASIELVKMFPNQKFVLDHIAKPHIKEGETDNWESKIRLLSNFQNVWCKISGMVTEADWHLWEYKDFVPYLDIIFDSFDMDKIMFGSDWPVCTLAADYAKVKQIVTSYISEFSQSDQLKIWGQNAIEFYDLDVS